jgi:hypothetical protein
MKWDELLARFSTQPLFHTSHLAVFPDAPENILVQLSRWVASGKLAQIRRGWYLIEKPYRTRDVRDAAIANAVLRPSYLSLEWALQYHGMIPEATFQPTSITTGRGTSFEALNRVFLYHHIAPSLFNGYRSYEIAGERIAAAIPEKSLLDLIYIFVQRNRFSILWLESLRLQNLDRFDTALFLEMGASVRKRGFAGILSEAAEHIAAVRESP